MRKSKFAVGTKTNGGNTITRVITKSTGYVELTRADGSTFKDMAFNLKDKDGNPLKKKPKSSGMSRGEKKRARDAREIAIFDSLPNLQKIKKSLLWINGTVFGDRNSLSYQLWIEILQPIQDLAKEKGNDFIVNVCDSGIKYMKLSEKQAYYVARFADENGIKHDKEEEDKTENSNKDLVLRLAKAKAAALKLKLELNKN